MNPIVKMSQAVSVVSALRFGAKNIWRGGLSLALVLALSTAVLALDAKQQAVLGQAESGLKHALGNLDAARSSAGTAANPATGSRLRLTQMRLDSAKQGLAQVAGLLGKLPADDTAVAGVKTNYDAAMAVVAQIDAILSPPPAAAEAPKEAPKQDDTASSASEKTEAPAANNAAEKPADTKPAAATPAAPAAPAAAAPKAAPRLHYQQEDQLKNVNYYLREAQGWTNAVNKVIADIDDPNTVVVHRTTVVALNTIEQARGRIASANKALAQLPADHPKVVPVIQETKTINDALGAAHSRLTAEEAKLDKLANLKYYPNYDKDSALLSELTSRYGNFNETAQQPEKMVAVISEDGQALKEIQRIAKTYIPLVEQKTEAGESIEKQFNYFQTQRAKFAQQLGEYKKTLPIAFEKDLAQASELAKTAVEQQKPAYFGVNSGIEQNFGFAEKKLLVLEAMGKEDAAPYRAKLDATRADIKQKGKSLEQQIINSNTLPPDRFQGPDRDAIVAIAKDGWSYQQKDANVLMVRIPTEAWERTTKWEWFDGGFYKVDYSRVQAQLIIKRDGKTAVIQPVNVRKDHLKGDKLTGHPMRSGDEEVEPQSILLLEKVK